jgi:hypothetical protein
VAIVSLMRKKGQILCGVVAFVALAWAICPRVHGQFTEGPPGNPSAAGITTGSPAPIPVPPHVTGSTPSPVPPYTGGGPFAGTGASPSLQENGENALSPRSLAYMEGIPDLLGEPSTGRLVRVLGLSADQAKGIEDVRNRFYRDTRNMRYELLRRRLEMRALFSDPTVVRSALVAREKELRSLWQKLMEASASFVFQARQLLTPEQIERLERLPERQ